MVQFSTAKDLDSRKMMMRNIDLVLDIENVELGFSKSLLASGNKNSRLPIGNFAAAVLFVGDLLNLWQCHHHVTQKCVRKAKRLT